MRKLKLFFIAMTCVSIMTGCFIDVDDDDGFFGCTDGEGPIISEELNLDPFTGIELSINASVFVTQGPIQSVFVEGQQNIIDEIDRSVRNGIWEIELDDCVRNMEPLKVTITIPNVTSLRISGSGELVSENVLVIDDIDLNISGSGDMDIAMEADDIESRISGSGTIIMEGVADDIDLEISGSGDYRAFNLEANRANVEIRGSGDAEVFVRDELDVKISGSGDVLYKGNPSIDVEITGSGEVIDAN